MRTPPVCRAQESTTTESISRSLWGLTRQVGRRLILSRAAPPVCTLSISTAAAVSLPATRSGGMTPATRTARSNPVSTTWSRMARSAKARPASVSRAAPTAPGRAGSITVSCTTTWTGMVLTRLANTSGRTVIRIPGLSVCRGSASTTTGLICRCSRAAPRPVGPTWTVSWALRPACSSTMPIAPAAMTVARGSGMRIQLQLPATACSTPRMTDWLS